MPPTNEKKCECPRGLCCFGKSSTEKCKCPSPPLHTDDWKKEFFERFGANKIWVSPSRDNVETIHEIYFFIASRLEAQRVEEQERALSLIAQATTTAIQDTEKRVRVEIAEKVLDKRVQTLTRDMVSFSRTGFNEFLEDLSDSIRKG